MQIKLIGCRLVADWMNWLSSLERLVVGWMDWLQVG